MKDKARVDFRVGEEKFTYIPQLNERSLSEFIQDCVADRENDLIQ